MNTQSEYLLRKVSNSPNRVSSIFFNLIALFIFYWLSIWYFQPTTTLANLPYCLGALFTEEPPLYDQSNGIITGVFVSEKKWSHGDYYDMLRFYEDGLVMSVSATSRDIEIDWRKISPWFNRHSKRSEDLYGKYEFEGNNIYFTTYRHEDHWAEPLITNWMGTYSNDEILVSWIEHWPADIARGTEIFTRLAVDRCPFYK